MKKFLLLSAAAFGTATLLSYTFKTPEPKPLTAECYISCFNAAARDLIQSDAARPGFAALHPYPKQFTLENPIGTIQSFKTPDGIDAQGYVIKAKKKALKNIGNGYNTKLTETNVRQIKSLLAKGKTLKEIALKYKGHL